MANEETTRTVSQEGAAPPEALPPAPAPRLIPHGVVVGAEPLGNPAHALATQTAVPDAATLLRAVRRHWFLIAMLGLLVGGAAAAGIWMSVPGKYVATALVRVHSTPPRVLYDAKELGAPNNFGMYMRTQQQLMRLTGVLDRALNYLKPDSADNFPEEMEPIWRGTISFVREQQDGISWLNRQLSVRASRRSEFMQVSVEHDNPIAARDLTNVVVLAYLDEVSRENAPVADRRDQLEQLAKAQMQMAETNLEVLRSEVKSAGGSNTSTLSAQQQIVIDNMGMLSKQAMQTYLQILQTQVDLQIAKDRFASAQASLARFEQSGVSEEIAAAAAAEYAMTEQDESQTARSAEQAPANTAGDAMDGETEGSATPPPLKTIAPPDNPDMVNAVLQRDPSIRALQQQVQAHARRVESIEEKAKRPDEPILVRARARLEEAQKELTERTAQLKPVAEEALRTAHLRRHKADVTRLEKLLPELVAQHQQLSAHFEAKRKDIGKFGVQSFNLEMARKDVARDEELLDRIQLLQQKLQIESDAPARIEVREWAVAPKTLNNTRRTKLAAFGGMGGFAAVAFVVGLIEVRRRRIMVPDDVARRVGVAVVGTVPELPLRARRSAGGMMADAAGPWYRVFQESVDGLRAQLMYARPDQSVRTVMVTSAVSGEGKTELATHLAVSLARAGQRTLLIDTDLRRPMLHELFDTAAAPGVVELVAGLATKEQALVQTPFLDLDLLAAGGPAPDPTKLLTDERFGQLIAQLRQEYRFVILDLPPVLPFSDALLVGQHVDGALFSVLRDVSQTHHLRSASERLRGVGVGIIGAVLGGMIYDDFMYRQYRSAAEEAAAS